MAPDDRDFECASQPQSLQLPRPVRCVAEKMPTAETRWDGVLVMRVSIWIVVAALLALLVVARYLQHPGR
jgi:hypothetical protein